MAKSPLKIPVAGSDEAARRAALQNRLSSGIRPRVSAPEMHPTLLALEPRRKTVLARERRASVPAPSIDATEPSDDSDTVPVPPPPSPKPPWHENLQNLKPIHVIAGSVGFLFLIAVVTLLISR
jgi:hypothetical protein